MHGVTPARDPFDAVTLEQLRRRTGTKWSSYAADVIPAWVADSDAPMCPAVRSAIEGVLDAGDLGYPERALPALVGEAFAERMDVQFGWRADATLVRPVTDVVHAFSWLIDRYTATGDGVVLQAPVYPPFIEAVDRLERRLAFHELARDDRLGWRLDPEGVEAAVDDHTRVLVLVNPHNPTGRCFTSDELRAFGEVAIAHDLVVVADEIHAELTHTAHHHIPFASLGSEFAARTITLSSVSKAFNLGGLRGAVVHFGSSELMERWDEIPAFHLGEVSTPSMVASIAAWRDGGAWLDDMRAALTARRDRVAAFIAEHLPDLCWWPPQATYLAWLDMTTYELGDDPAAFFETQARVALSHGPEFGPPGRGFVRLNFATTVGVLDEVLERMVTALDHR